MNDRANSKRLWSLLAAAACLAAALFTTGCASTGRSQSKAATGGLEKITAVIEQTGNQVETTLTALNKLKETGTGDLRTPYKNFSSAVGKMQALAEKASTRRLELQTKADTYFAHWDAQAAEMQNAEIKKASDDRRQSLKTRFDAIGTNMDKLKALSDPFLTGLAEINKYLDLDLTAPGVSRIESVIQKANVEGQDLLKRLRSIQNELKTLTTEMSGSMANGQ